MFSFPTKKSKSNIKTSKIKISRFFKISIQIEDTVHIFFVLISNVNETLEQLQNKKGTRNTFLPHHMINIPYLNLNFPFQAIPFARITWRYGQTFINNGSTLLNDIDMRHYYHVETPILENQGGRIQTLESQVNMNLNWLQT